MRVISAIINDIYTDQRVKKQTAVLKSLGCDIVVVCRNLSSNSDNEDVFKSVKFSFCVNHGPLFYFFYNLRLLIYLIFHRFDLYVANDLDTLLPCFIMSRIRKKPLVYDAHEYFTGQYGLDPGKIPFKTWKKIEKTIIPRLKYMITVSNSIADLYYNEYGVKPLVIRNLPYSSKDITKASRGELGISNDDLLIVIQGAGLNPGRGIMELLDAVKITDGIHLLVIGSGDSENEIKTKVEDLRLKNKVTLLPKMEWERMMTYTKMCDAGVTLDQNNCINQRFSLPNKLFDYISAEIPVIASALPEIKKIVEQFDCGILIENVNEYDISKGLALLRDDKKLLDRLKTGAFNASERLKWSLEKEKESKFFHEIIMAEFC